MPRFREAPLWMAQMGPGLPDLLGTGPVPSRRAPPSSPKLRVTGASEGSAGGPGVQRVPIQETLRDPLESIHLQSRLSFRALGH